MSDLYEGSIILPRGSIGQVLMDENGNSVSRSELIGFNHQGEKVEKVPSIFSIENNCKRVDIDDFFLPLSNQYNQLVINEDQIDKWENILPMMKYTCLSSILEDYEEMMHF